MASITVFGLGYVGTVSAACLARDGHDVIGVDVSRTKLDAIAAGHSPIVEPGLEELVAAGVASGRLRVSDDTVAAVAASDLSLVCVGTPSRLNGSLDLSYVRRVCEQIGQALRDRAPGHVVCMRSTMLPGSIDEIVRPVLAEASGRTEGEHYFVAINPEYLRETTAIADYDHPPKVVIGTDHPQAAEVLASIYAHLPAKQYVVPARVAELDKYTANAWHALKVAFANEIGALARDAGVDSHAVAELFLADTQLNISPRYLRPGFAFGGSCLPKDVKALAYHARKRDLEVPVLAGVLPSNAARIEDVVQRVLALDTRDVGMYGLSFKRGTDDLRGSPFVTVAERLIGKGVRLRIYDENIQPSRLTGTNKDYIDAHIPHLVDLLVDGFDALAGVDAVLVHHKSPEAAAWVRARPPEVRVIDLARLDVPHDLPGYEGVSW